LSPPGLGNPRLQPGGDFLGRVRARDRLGCGLRLALAAVQRRGDPPLAERGDAHRVFPPRDERPGAPPRGRDGLGLPPRLRQGPSGPARRRALARDDDRRGAARRGLVLFGLVADDDSIARAAVMGLHLVNTLLLLGALTLAAFWASGGRGFSPWGHGGMG